MAMTDEQRKARLHHHMYETCEGIAEHAERIVRLEEFVLELCYLARIPIPNGDRECDTCTIVCVHNAYGECTNDKECWYEMELKELGIEVDE